MFYRVKPRRTVQGSEQKKQYGKDYGQTGDGGIGASCSIIHFWLKISPEGLWTVTIYTRFVLCDA